MFDDIYVIACCLVIDVIQVGQFFREDLEYIL